MKAQDSLETTIKSDDLVYYLGIKLASHGQKALYLYLELLTLEGRLFANTYKDGMGHFDPCIIMLQNVNA